MKTKIIKNSSCIFAFILILVAFLIFYFSNNNEIAMPYILPVVMLEFITCIFSFFWSIKKKNMIRGWNINLIISLVCAVFILIVLQAINTVLSDSSTMKELFTILMDIFYVLVAIGCLFCLSFPIYFDFFYEKKKIESKNR